MTLDLLPINLEKNLVASFFLFLLPSYDEHTAARAQNRCQVPRGRAWRARAARGLSVPRPYPGRRGSLLFTGSAPPLTPATPPASPSPAAGAGRTGSGKSGRPSGAAGHGPFRVRPTNATLRPLGSSTPRATSGTGPAVCQERCKRLGRK